MPELYHVPVPSAFGELGLVWSEAEGAVKLQAVLLPDEREATAAARSCPEIDALCEQVRHSLLGEAVDYDLDMLAWGRCSDWQQRVLVAEYGVPCGKVSTYGRVAAHLGAPRAARAVGRALATNPFPIIIPCHRAVRSDGALGGYRGGVPMKRKLLELEGVPFTTAGKVAMEGVWY